MHRLILSVAALLIVSCDSGSCELGMSEPCACPDGSSSIAVCSSTGELGPCACGSLDGGDRDAGADGGGSMMGTGETVTEVIGPEGGEVRLMNATLTIAAGALSTPTSITATESTTPTPAGYRAFSPLYRFEPAGLALAAPATVSIRSNASGADVPLGTLFWSRTAAEGRGWARLGGIPTGGQVAGEVAYLGDGFVADGVDYSETPDTSCVRTRVLTTRTLEPSGVGLFFAMDDCWGRPVTELESDDIRVFEDDVELSSEATAELFPQRGLQVFITLAIDVSASTRPIQAEVIAAARSFVQTLNQPTRGLRDRVQVAVIGFAGEGSAGFSYPHTLDLDLVLAHLDELATYTPLDASSTNLHGAMVQALGVNRGAQQSFQSLNRGGAFTAGYVVVFTDGADTSGRVPLADVQLAVGQSFDDIVAVGLEGSDYDPAALRALFATPDDPSGALAPVIDAADAVVLDRDFAYLAARIAGQVRRSYLLGYCSPKRSGTHTVHVGHADATQNPRVWGILPEFTADGFAGGCATAMFAPEATCGDAECGGFGCGACDDRVAACSSMASETRPGACVSHCIARNQCTGETITAPGGYELVCATSIDATPCDGRCATLSTDPSNCGACGATCAVGCAAGECVGAIDVALGETGGCAIDTDGGVRCWGAVRALEDRVIRDATQIIVVSDGSREHGCALRAGGAVTCWPNGMTVDAMIGGFVEIEAVGPGAVRGRLADGRVRGFNSYDGFASSADFLTNVAQISTPCALFEDGSVSCWSPPFPSTPTPVLMAGETAIRLAPGGHALLADGSVVRFTGPTTRAGVLPAGTLGSDVDELVVSQGSVLARGGGALSMFGAAWPSADGGGATSGDGRFWSSGGAPGGALLESGVTSLAMGAYFRGACVGSSAFGLRCLSTQQAPPGEQNRMDIDPRAFGPVRSVADGCAVAMDGTVWCWGSGPLGLGAGAPTAAATPVQVPGITDATEVVGTSGEAFWVRHEDGSVSGWGRSVGDGTTSLRTSPVIIAGLDDVTQLATGHSHTCALRGDGTVRCWGANSVGEVGDGSTSPQYAPVPVVGLSGVTKLALAEAVSCALLDDGTGRCWGYNANGALGDGTTTHQSTPVVVLGVTDAVDVAVAAGGSSVTAPSSSVFHLADGQLVERGAPVSPALDVDELLGRAADGVLLRLADGSLACRGSCGVLLASPPTMGWQEVTGLCGRDGDGLAWCSTRYGDGFDARTDRRSRLFTLAR